MSGGTYWDLKGILSEIRDNYSCFDEEEEPYYRALSEAIRLASTQPENEKRKEESAQNVPKEDLISRKVAIEAILSRTNCKSVRDLYEYNAEHELYMMWTGGIVDAIDMVIGVPSAEPDTDEWCTDCSEYDHERHCCPRWNKVIREALKDMQIEKRTAERTKTHACDSISRQVVIDDENSTRNI